MQPGRRWKTKTVLARQSRDCTGSSLPAANPELRQQLESRLNQQSSNATSVTRESKLPKNGSDSRWPRWMLVLSLLLLASAMGWWMITPAMQQTVSEARLNALVEHDFLIDAQGGVSSEDSTRQSNSPLFATLKQMGGIEIRERGEAGAAGTMNPVAPEFSLGGDGSGDLSGDASNERQQRQQAGQGGRLLFGDKGNEIRICWGYWQKRPTQFEVSGTCLQGRRQVEDLNGPSCF